MNPNSSIESIAAGCISAPSFASQNLTVVPPWWRADQDHFETLRTTRTRIHRHEKAAAKRALYVMGASLVAAVSIYSVDATSAAAIPAAPGFLAFVVAVALPMVVAWLLDRRLVQQLNDVDLRSHLWQDLVESVRHGRIDVPQLTCQPGRETEIEQFLRKEAALAARFLASGRRLAPHLPIFGHCFTLENK